MSRPDGRGFDELRPIQITPGFLQSAPSALIEVGQTRVLCTAIIEESVPPWMRGQGRGWLTAEYGMLPASTGQRKQRDATKGKLDGRTVEIQRLIGRSLRAVVDLGKLGANTLWLDCDVLQADGGTRTAAITGAYVAARLAVQRLLDEKRLTENPLADSVAAVSVGICGGQEVLDLAYLEDKDAAVDFNVVATGRGQFVEVQGSGEEATFSPDQLASLITLAQRGLREVSRAQTAFLTQQLLAAPARTAGPA